MSNVPVHDESQPVPVRAGITGTKVVLVRADDTIETVCRVQRQSPFPLTLFVLSEQCTVFRDHSDFVRLKGACVAGQYVAFVILNETQRVDLGSLALHHGFYTFASLEKAQQTLAGLNLHDTAAEDLPVVSAPSPNGAIPPANEPLSRVPSKKSSAEKADVTKRRRPVLASRGRLFILHLLQYFALVTVAVLLFVSIGLAYGGSLPLLTKSAAPVSAPPSVGQLSFSSSWQFDPQITVGYNDIVSLQLHGLPAPHQGKAYYAWLLPDPTDNTHPPLSLGRVDIQQVSKTGLMYSSPTHTNLLANYSGVCVTEQAAGPSAIVTLSPNHGDRLWQGAFPMLVGQHDQSIPLLSHLRNLLAADPILASKQVAGGLVIWTMRSVVTVEQFALAAQGQWNDALTIGDVQAIHRQMLSILQYLDGQSYYTSGVPSALSKQFALPQAATFGLLDIQQNRDSHGLFYYVTLHLTGFGQARGHTQQQGLLVQQANTVISQMSMNLRQVWQDAHDVLQYDLKQLRQPSALHKLNEMAILTNEALSGHFDSQRGQNVGGIIWLRGVIQQLATIPLTAS